METLSFYNIETATVVTTLNLGTAAPSSSDDTMLRVINNSDLYQAEDVTVTVTGSDAIQLWLSSNGDSYRNSVQLGDIAPGGGSQPFWLRRVTPSTASGAFSASLSAEPSGWSNPVDTTASDNIPLTED